MVNHIDWSSYAKPTLNSWNVIYLIYCCTYFCEILRISDQYLYIVLVVIFFSFITLSHFDVRVMLALPEWARKYYIFNFQEDFM